MMKSTTIAVVTACLLTLGAGAVHADVIYDATPFNLSDGYTIVGGTITTNDARTQIVAWNIEVTGPRPFTFSNTNPGASVTLDGFVIGPNDITITQFTANSTGFLAFDNSPADCTNCRQELTYVSSGPEIFYQVFDFEDSDPAIFGSLQFTPVVTVATVQAQASPAPALSRWGSTALIVVMLVVVTVVLMRGGRTV